MRHSGRALRGAPGHLLSPRRSAHRLSSVSGDPPDPLDARRGARRAGDDHPLRPLAGGDPWPRGRELPRPLALVGDRPRGVLGLDLGVLRRSRVGAVRARPRLAVDARGASGSPAPASTTPSTSFRSRRRTRSRSGTHPSCGRSPRRPGASSRRRRGAPRRRCARPASGRATASSPTCRTSSRRSSRSTPARASVRSGRAARPTSASRSVVDRFAQIEPRVLLAVDGYRYGGRDHDRLEVVRALQRAMPTLERTVVLGYLDPEPASTASGARPRWDDFLDEGGDEALEFAQVAFDHPLWVLYSSGTTGLPKAIVHGHGGILLEHLKKLHLHVDLQQDDRLFWFTTTGWMMWNFLVGGLLTEASIVLYDGNPGHPDLGTLWGLAEEAGITCFGTSASFVAACMKDGVDPRPAGLCRASMAVGSTGSPLSPEGFDWVYDELGPDAVALLDVGRHGRLHRLRRRRPDAARLPWRAAGPGARREGRGVDAGRRARRRRGRRARDHGADAVDADRPLGRRGRLPLPRELLRHVPRRLAARRLDRDHRTRHRDHHRPLRRDDQPRRDPDGDGGDLPCRAGARRGRRRARRRPAAQGTQGYMPLFVVLRDGVELDDELVARIRARIREDCSPRHVPDEIRPIARGAAHAVGQGARGARQADPERRAGGHGAEPRLARRTPTRSARSRSSPQSPEWRNA